MKIITSTMDGIDMLKNKKLGGGIEVMFFKTMALWILYKKIGFKGSRNGCWELRSERWIQ